MKTKTVAIHAGERLVGSKAQPLSAPVYTSAVSYFDGADDLDASLDGKDYVYTRIAGQNAALLEEAVAALEGTEACVAYATGMAALKAVFEAVAPKAGERVAIASDGYGATRALYKQLVASRGAELVAIALCEADAPAQIAQARAKLVLAESITNPLVSVPDLPALARACRDSGALFAVDATFASPVLQQACALGADYAIQSTTKWMNGHSDAMGGTVSGSRKLIDPLRSARILDGAVLGPFEAWLTLRGLRTLPVRMKAHCEHAVQVAKRLTRSELISRVYFPGLPEHPHHEVARRVLSGFGGMLAFEIAGGDRKEAFALLENVRIARPAPSLGDVATLVMHPATASARKLTPAERQAAGINENAIRVSVGLEDPDDVADDLLAAVAKAVAR
jgi:cystathionine gamma-synthase